MGMPSKLLSRWYTQLATNLEAGLSLEQSIGSLAGPPATDRHELQARLQAGDSVEEALERGGAWLPTVDRQLFAAGASSGRLPDVLRRLASWHEERAAAAGRMWLAAIYPALLAHFAIFALPISDLIVRGDVSGYLEKVLRVLVPLWSCVGLFAFALRRDWRVAAGILDLLPFIGGHRRASAIANLAMALEAQLVAGVRLDVAWLHAALAAGDRRLEEVAVLVAEGVQRGEAVGAKLAGRRELPAPFAEFYTNGEQTGRLDENLALLQREFRQRASSRLQIATLFYPGVLFAIVGVTIAYQILSFWLGYFRQLEQFQ